MGVSDVFNIQDAWMGDNRISKFLDYHDSVYQNLDEQARSVVEHQSKIRWEFLHRAMASSKVSAEDWHHFERMKPTDPNKNYEYLRGLIDAHLTREDTKKNLAARKLAMEKKRGKDFDPAAPA